MDASCTENGRSESPKCGRGFFWIIRVLFEPIELGRRIPPPFAFVRQVDDAVEADWPLNPIVVINDIPFRFIGGGIAGAGMPEHPRSHIDFVRKHCVIRDARLQPSVDPVLTGVQLLESPLVPRMPGNDRESATRDIQSQAISLLPKERHDHLNKERQQWTAAKALSTATPLQWDDQKGFKDPDTN